MILKDSIRRHFENVAPKYIEWDFYKNYIDVEPPFGQLGLPVFLRTYSRHIPSEKRREKWIETVLRNVEFSIGLDNVTSYAELKKEAKELFDYIFNLRTFPSGRSLWVAGSQQTQVDPSSVWNCTFRSINSITSFSEIFYWLLIGAGCGFSVEQKYIDLLPYFYNENKTISHTGENVWIKNNEETVFAYDCCVKNLTNLDLTLSDYEYRRKINIPKSVQNIVIYVGDSKQGWCNAVRLYLTLLTYEQSLNITFDYSWVRPKGEPLKVFGGRASGCRNLIDLFDRMHETISANKLSSVNCLDLVCIIGCAVVSGGIRRTALIGLGGAEDDEFKTAKYKLWQDPAKAKYTKYRVMSNNSIAEKSKKPDRQVFDEMFIAIKSNGEPGIWNVGNAQKYDEQIIGTNPCGESGLRDKQSCNLTTNNVLAFVKKTENGDTYFDEENWRKSLYLSTRIGSRVTTLSQWHPEWDRVQKSQRLLGVSMTGLMDAVDTLGWDEKQLESFLIRSQQYVRDVADSYHERLSIERSTRITLFKPEGSLSQLPTVSSGIHRAYSPQYLRRVRFSAIDPLAKALLNVVGQSNVKPENGQGEDIMNEHVDTWVFTFPIRTKAKIRAIDEPAITQLERYKLAQSTYTADGHNTSVTVTVAEDEWDDVADWVYKNWESIIGVSFLPKYDPEKDVYPQMPYEPCSVDKYKGLKNIMPTFSENQLITLISKYEDNYDEYQILEDACASGACPLR
jgi:adenosylcobalamin-dependent ribonucleoside-triphosphate reductase